MINFARLGFSQFLFVASSAIRASYSKAGHLQAIFFFFSHLGVGIPILPCVQFKLIITMQTEWLASWDLPNWNLAYYKGKGRIKSLMDGLLLASTCEPLILGWLRKIHRISSELSVFFICRADILTIETTLFLNSTGKFFCWLHFRALPKLFFFCED